VKGGENGGLLLLYMFLQAQHSQRVIVLTLPTAREAFAGSRRPTAVLTDIWTLLCANRKIQEIFYTVLC